MSKYSLWFVPPTEVQSQLTDLVERLSKEFYGFLFEPHVTLLGNIAGEESDVLNTSRLLAQQLEPMTLAIARASFSTTYFQSVLLQVEASKELLGAHVLARDLFKQEPTPFFPHISILYGDHDLKIRELAAKSVSLPRTTFSVNSLIVTPAEPNPQDWKHLGEFTFGK